MQQQQQQQQRGGSCSTTTSVCSSSSSSIPHTPPKEDGPSRRRRRVMLGGSLMVLCCCSLANATAAAAGAGGGGGGGGRKSVPAFLRPLQVRSTYKRDSSFDKPVLVPPMRVSYTSSAGAPSPSPVPTTTTAGYVTFNNLSSVAITQETTSAMPLPPSQAAARPSQIPRPINLPGLSKEDLILLRAGQRVQHQIRNGCMGSGYVVVDVLADSKTVWDTLLNFERYAEMIPTIRKVRVNSRWRTLTKGIFTLSKFRFRLSVCHKHRPQENRLDFYLDPDSDQYRSILEMAEGFWYIEDKPADRPEGWTRVYMSATVKVNNLVPMWLVEYAAERALKRATSWLKPFVEQRGGKFD